MRLTDLLPDANVLLALPTEELALPILQVAKKNLQNGIIHPDEVLSGCFTNDVHARGNPSAYAANLEMRIRMAVGEAWTWLLTNQLLVRDPGYNGNNGYVRIGRKAEQLTTVDDFSKFMAAASFPKSLLHPRIAEDVWSKMARGEFDLAVFVAFRTVEEEVRSAGGFADTDIGTQLMRKAFDAENGPLRKSTDPLAEREALAHLFTGAIGSYKNPHSHRTVALRDPKDAQEMVVLASHLLRIVDARRPQ